MYVTTTFLPATDTRPERIKAVFSFPHSRNVSVTVPWNNSLTFRDNHEFALSEVLRKANHGNDTFVAVCLASKLGGGFIFVSKYLPTVDYIRTDSHRTAA
jgi:hypothetical protein